MAMAPPPPSETDDQLVARLARLQQRRQAATPADASIGGPGGTPRPTAGRTRHPAAGARAGALVLSLAATGGLGVLFAHLNSGQAAARSLAALPAPIPVVAGTSVPSAISPVSSTTASTTAVPPRSTAPTTVATAPAAAPQAFNGSTVDTRYGPVQVQAQLTNGTITEVAVIAYPDTEDESLSINASALPQLRTEVLAAQRADVDTVSGATYTSDAYRQSLQAAIDGARAAGVTTIA